MKLIGISAHTHDELFRNKNKVIIDSLNRHYSNAVVKAGGAPIIIPNILNHDLIKKYVKICDGFILSGGNDINAKFYKENFDPNFVDLNESELLLCIEILKSKKPLLGICRGLQVLNVCLGGTLIEDITSELDTNINHSGSGDRYSLEHNTRVTENTRLNQILKIEEMMTNSFHHQSIDKVAPSLIVTAVSPDDIIEAVEKEGDEFIVAVQWHPEAMVAKDDTHLELFKALVDSCK